MSPKSSFDELNYDQRLLAIEQSRLQALHHSTGLGSRPVGCVEEEEASPPAEKQRRRGSGRRLVHSLSDSLIVRQRKGRWRGTAEAALVGSGCAHGAPPQTVSGDAVDEGGSARRPGWRGRLTRSARGRRLSSSTSRLPDPSPIPSAVDVPVLVPTTALLEEDSATRIQAAYRGFCSRKGAGAPPVSPPQRPSDEERAAMYRDQIDAYAPRPSPEVDGPVSPIRPPSTPCAPPAIQLVECEDGAVRPSVGLSFAFVTSAEKLGLMLEPQSPDAGARPTGDLIVESRRRSSSLTNCPAMELDFSAVRLIDDEVQKFVTQKYAPKPKIMPKPKRSASFETTGVSSPVNCLPRATSSLTGVSTGGAAVVDDGAIPRVQDSVGEQDAF